LIDPNRLQSASTRILRTVALAVTILLTLLAARIVLGQGDPSALQESQNQPNSPTFMLQSSLQKQIEILGPDHPHVAITLNSLAEHTRADGMPREAIPLYHRAIRIWEESEGSINLNLAKMLNGLGGAYRDVGDDASAYRTLVRSLQIREQVYGPAHVEVAIALNNLGVLAEESGRFEEAERIYGRAIRIMEAKPAPEQVAIISMLTNLGSVLEKMGRVDEALAAHQRAALLRSRIGGTN